MAKSPDTKLGRYEVLKRLATGTTTDLLLARASRIAGFERHLVIKQLHPEQAKDRQFVDMFLSEARLAAALHHHNIIQVYEIGTADRKPFFAMEYVHGEDLRSLLSFLHSRGEQLPLEHIVAILSAVAAALHHAHEHRGPNGESLGIVHRDVTPTNIMVTFDGNVKVTDFGIAKAAMSLVRTQAGVLKGKVPYLAPEQCLGKPADRRSDVFSLGVVAYELITGRRLFKAASEYETMSAIVAGDIPRPSHHRNGLPATLEQIVLKALAREPEQRFQTAQELGIALDGYATAAGTSTSPTKLARYLQQLFGPRPEPWATEAEARSRPSSPDFDGVEPLAEPPRPSQVMAIPESLAAAPSSPIMHARARIAKTEPARPSAIMAAIHPGVPVAIIDDEPDLDDVKTSVRKTPPTQIAAVRRERHETEIVEPLPNEKTGTVLGPRLPTYKSGWRRSAVFGAASTVFVAGLVAIGFTGSTPLGQQEAQAETAKPVEAPAPAAPADKPWDQMTARDYERARAAAVSPARAPAAPAPATPEPAKVAVEPARVTVGPVMVVEPTPAAIVEPPAPVATTEPLVHRAPRPEHPAEHVTEPHPHHVAAAAKQTPTPERPTRPPVAKPAKATVAQPATKPTKPAPKWDPDALFPKS